MAKIPQINYQQLSLKITKTGRIGVPTPKPVLRHTLVLGKLNSETLLGVGDLR